MVNTYAPMQDSSKVTMIKPIVFDDDSLGAKKIASTGVTSTAASASAVSAVNLKSLRLLKSDALGPAVHLQQGRKSYAV